MLRFVYYVGGLGAATVALLAFRSAVLLAFFDPFRGAC
jgi:hypothetical protein